MTNFCDCLGHAEDIVGQPLQLRKEHRGHVDNIRICRALGTCEISQSHDAHTPHACNSEYAVLELSQVSRRTSGACVESRTLTLLYPS
jgi:hypothetical protein